MHLSEKSFLFLHRILHVLDLSIALCWPAVFLVTSWPAAVAIEVCWLGFLWIASQETSVTSGVWH